MKGIDIISKAMGKLVKCHTPAEKRPRLVLRGCPKGEQDALCAYVDGKAENQALHVRCLDWATPDGIIGDLLQCSLCVMPSRSEPFGLAALEAVAIGVPVLVSSQSGLAEFLRRVDEPLARMMIVETSPRESPTSLIRDSKNWKRAIAEALGNLVHRFDLANKMRQAIRSSGVGTTAALFVQRLCMLKQPHA